MSDAITHALKKLYFLIPNYVLVEAFQPQKQLRSLDGLIKEKIITDIVLPDCNLYSGKIKKVKVLSSYAVTVDSLGGVLPFNSASYCYFQIPKSQTENRRIIHALDLCYPLEAYASYGYLQNIGGNSIPSLANRALTSFTESPNFLIPNVIVMDDNIIRLDPPQSYYTEWMLSCMLEYDSNFTNVSIHMYEDIAELVRYATEQYIYNELYTKIDHAELVGGKNLGVIKNIVEKYESSYEKYQAALKSFRGSASMDKDNLIDLVSLMFP